MAYYVVIDTNVFISALLSKNSDAATVKLLRAILDGRIVPLYHNYILSEYDDVLHREKFHFKETAIQMVLMAVKESGWRLLEKGSRKPYIIEMNAQGDLLHRDVYGENRIYRRQVEIMRAMMSK